MSQTAAPTITYTQLVEAVLSLPPLRLQGMALQAGRHPNGGPLPPPGREYDQLVADAMVEYLVYEAATTKLRDGLAHLRPVPSPLEILEYGL